MDVDIHPQWIKIVIQNKVLQLTMDEPVLMEGAICERSKVSGQLVVRVETVRSVERLEAEGESLQQHLRICLSRILQ